MHQIAMRLTNGETVRFKPKGQSMRPRIISGQTVTLMPVDDLAKRVLAVGDVVLAKVRGTYYLHKIGAISRYPNPEEGYDYRIENNRGVVNGWTSLIYGKVVDVE